ncbi:glucosamine inositolphosphorylceramide transferase family protein [Georgenia daeguensis]|uniref:Glucosamine inositolphosphorylceramide transferase 1 N-terminal domain-containing protein n=1 Tax=Georgenia daeguensis TaxID=908355 RepID=A0ABP8ESM9_9MICO
MGDRPVRVGLICTSPHVTAYTKDFIDWAARQDDVEVTHLILARAPAGGPGTRAGLPLTLRALSVLESAVLRRLRGFRDHGRTVDLGELMPRVTLAARTAPDGVLAFDDAAARTVRSLGLDVLVANGTRMRGPVLEVPRLGTLAVQHEVDPLGPPGFWEVLHGRASTVYSIHRLTADGGSVVVRRGRTWTGLFAELNHAIVMRRSYHHLQLLLKELARPGAPAAEPRLRPARPEPGEGWAAPAPATTADTLRYAARVAGTVTPKLVDKALGRPRWNVAWVRAPWREAGTAHATELPRRRGHFYADPFVVARDGRHYLFTEDYQRGVGRGRIFVHEIAEGRSREVGVALAEPFHLSFPYLFEHAGELYLVPESAKDRSIRIYRCTRFPLGWELVRVAMRDVDAVDTMIFPFGGRWWLLTSIAPPGTGDYSAELFAFHADSPLAQTWHPHAGNPLVMDPRRARNGGIVLDGGEVYRVNQRHGFGTYGEGAAVNRIVELTPTTFVEEPVTGISPNASLRVRRTHQLHTDGEYTVFDYVRTPRLRPPAVHRSASRRRTRGLVRLADPGS